MHRTIQLAGVPSQVFNPWRLSVCFQRWDGHQSYLWQPRGVSDSQERLACACTCTTAHEHCTMYYTLSQCCHLFMEVYSIVPDASEAWWLSGVEDIFGSSMTAATTSVLQSELDSCQELLQLEPDNKCEPYLYLAGFHLVWGGGRKQRRRERKREFM